MFNKHYKFVVDHIFVPRFTFVVLCQTTNDGEAFDIGSTSGIKNFQTDTKPWQNSHIFCFWIMWTIVRIPIETYIVK